MTDQEIFNKVVTSIILQGKQSLQDLHSGHDRCAYRGANGTKCAAGHLLPDDLYVASLEGQTIDGVYGLRGQVGDKLPWTQEQDRLVRSLQKAHDYASRDPQLDFTSQFVGAAIQIASANGLFYSDVISNALAQRALANKDLLKGPLVEKQL